MFAEPGELLSLHAPRARPSLHLQCRGGRADEPVVRGVPEGDDWKEKRGVSRGSRRNGKAERARSPSKELEAELGEERLKTLPERVPVKETKGEDRQARTRAQDLHRPRQNGGLPRRKRDVRSPVAEPQRRRRPRLHPVPNSCRYRTAKPSPCASSPCRSHASTRRFGISAK